MNVIELLKNDHEKVSKLFKSYEAAKKSESESDKEAIVAQLCEELSVHALAEEQLFYPAVEDGSENDEKAQDMVKEGQEEHKLVKTLVAELKEMSASEEQYDAKVKVLKDLVDHHVEEEEGQMMPKAKKLLSSEELEALGTQVESRKEELKAEYAEEQGKASGAASGRQNSPPAQSSGASSSRSSAGKGASSSSVEASRSPRPARRRPASGAMPSPAK
ncbi:MAG TPA: hemerythrin domain-containing protein, partial [Gemmatimonadota bacterium]|nr:hemerythrin domain-containing protein [Gemmatimonadota bacterium]